MAFWTAALDLESSKHPRFKNSLLQVCLAPELFVHCSTKSDQHSITNGQRMDSKNKKETKCRQKERIIEATVQRFIRTNHEKVHICRWWWWWCCSSFSDVMCASQRSKQHTRSSKDRSNKKNFEASSTLFTRFCSDKCSQCVTRWRQHWNFLELEFGSIRFPNALVIRHFYIFFPRKVFFLLVLACCQRVWWWESSSTHVFFLSYKFVRARLELMFNIVCVYISY